MLIVGGTYRERCAYPRWDTTQGSGMRAAAALSEVPDVRLLTAVDPDLAADATLVAGGAGIQGRTVVERTDTVGFSYFTPLSVPLVTGPDAVVHGVLEGDDDSVLVFGMLERVSRNISARRLVLDPQRPRSHAALEHDGLKFDELALLVNSTEARHFGRDSDVAVAAGNLLAEYRATTVVVKRGPGGCVVFTPGDRSRVTMTAVGAHPTSRVWPIGSGDTFAAGFTHAWGRGADAVEAARVGSAAAAFWCGTRTSNLPSSLLAGDTAVLDAAGARVLDPARTVADPRVYIAGPFFTLGEVWLVELVQAALAGQGVGVFSPLHDVGRGDASVAQEDIDGLVRSTALLALLDHSDSGTLFEAGYATRTGIPIVAYAFRPDIEGAKMLAGSGAELHDDLSTAVYRAAWRALGASPSTPTDVAVAPTAEAGLTPPRAE